MKVSGFAFLTRLTNMRVLHKIIIKDKAGIPNTGAGNTTISAGWRNLPPCKIHQGRPMPPVSLSHGIDIHFPDIGIPGGGPPGKGRPSEDLFC